MSCERLLHSNYVNAKASLFKHSFYEVKSASTLMSFPPAAFKVENFLNLQYNCSTKSQENDLTISNFTVLHPKIINQKGFL